MNQFRPPSFNSLQGLGEDIDTITTTSTAPRTRNTSELSAMISAAGGTLVVNANDSNFIVAANNSMRFSVTRLANGQYRITESQAYLYLIGAAIIGAVVVFSRR